MRGNARGLPILLLMCTALSSVSVRAQDDEPPRLGRWLAMQQAEVALRFRRQAPSDGAVDANRLEHRVALRGQVKLDEEGRQRVVFGAFSGDSFASGWNPSGVGGGTFSPAIYLKHLFLSLSLGTHFQIEYGSLYPIPGQSTATIGYDNERVSVRSARPTPRRAGPLRRARRDLRTFRRAGSSEFPRQG